MLPPNFPHLQLSNADLHRVEWYYGRYVEQFFKEYRFGHFIMAGYASVPALLTPDLLYKIWQNFYGYQWGRQTLAIHRIAVADLLLSPLCKEVGFELYEMHHDVRMAFQQWLSAASGSPEWKGRGLRSVDEVASFVRAYHTKPNPGMVRWGQGYSDVQEWGATAYSDHERVQQQLNARLLQALQSGREAEALRLMDIWAKTAQQLEGLYANQPDKDLSSLRDNAQMVTAWKSLLQQGSMAFLDKIEQIGRNHPFFNNNPEGGIAVEVPSLTKEKIEEIQVQTVWCLAIGIDQYPQSMGTLGSCVSDAKAFVEATRRWAKQQGQTFRSKSLLDEKATVKALNDQFNYFEKARDGDICVLYFAGHAEGQESTDNQGRGLVAVDSRTGTTRNDIAQGQLEAYIHAKIAHTAVQFICIYDTNEVGRPALKAGLNDMPHRSAPQQMKGSLLVLNAASIGQQSYEVFKTGLFTSSLLQVLSGASSPFTYRQLRHRIKALMKERQPETQQDPYWEAFPNTAQDRYFLSDRLHDTGIIPLQYDEDTAQWLLQPDADTVLRPSLDFYHTLVRPFEVPSPSYKVILAKDKQQFTLDGFEGNTDSGLPYEMVLVQNAPEKIAVALDADMDKNMRQKLENALKNRENRYFYLENDPARARFFLNSRGENFVLRNQKASVQDDPFSVQDLLALSVNIPSFIGSVERVCRWHIIAGLGVPVTDAALELKYGIVEGTNLNNPFLQLSAFNGTVFSAAAGAVDLHYRNNGSEWVPPAVQIEVSNKGPVPVYVQTLVLDTNHSITVQDAQRIEPGQSLGPASNAGSMQQNIVQQSQMQQSRVNEEPENWEPIPFSIDPTDYRMGIRTKPAFLKVFVSTQLLDLYPLGMSAADRAIKKGSGRLTTADTGTLKMDDAGLVCFTLPIRVVREAATASGTEPVAGNEAPPPPMLEYATVENETLAVVEKPEGELVIRQLKKGDQIEIVERQGAWVRIQNLLGIVTACRNDLDKGDFGKAFSTLLEVGLSTRWAETLEQISAQYFDIRRENEMNNLSEADFNRRQSELQGQFEQLLEELDQVQEWVLARFEAAPESGATPEPVEAEESGPVMEQGLESMEINPEIQRVYVGYMPEDERAWHEIERILAPFIERKSIEVRAGIPMQKDPVAATKQQIASADMVFLLVSKSFLEPQRLFSREEVQQAIVERIETGHKVIPIILEECDWESTYFGQLNPLSVNVYPVDSFEDQSEIWGRIGEAIHELLTGPQLA